MDMFEYRDRQLMIEAVCADQIAQEFGTPLYVYSKATLLHHYDALTRAFAALSPTICYSIKSCGNVHLCRLLAERGSGMDVVSGGEIHRAKLAGADMTKIVYAGVGKTDDEIRYGIESGIGFFNIESEAEFLNISRIAAEMNAVAHGALRVNPDVADDRTHAKTTTGRKETKFGVDIERARQFFQQHGHDPHCRVDAIHLHIGSPIYSPEPYVRAITRALELIDELRTAGYDITTLDIGGGYAADYETDMSPSYQSYADAIVPLLINRDLHIILEPGRTIAGNAGILLTRTLYTKQGGSKRFVIVDTGMNHLLRPSMYDAFHFMWPTHVQSDEHQPASRAAEMKFPGLEIVDVVGPICETGDTLAKGRALPPMQRGDLLAIFTAGAYGMTMASQYNAMPRPAEVLVDGDTATLIRRRETYDDLTEAEMNLV